MRITRLLTVSSSFPCISRGGLSNSPLMQTTPVGRPRGLHAGKPPPREENDTQV